jgi:DNA-binding response OmpR family regulator
MQSSTPASGSKRVLLVEDDPILAASVQRALRAAGHHSVWVSSAAGARALGGCYDVGVFDIHLAAESGIDLAVELLGARVVGRAVFFSATEDAALKARARTLGVFIPKDIRALIQELRP